MPIDNAVLKNELLTDPNAYGYAAKISIGDMGAIAELLNRVRTAISLPRPDVTPLEILEAINVDDFIVATNQTILMGSWFESLTQFPSIRILKENGTDARVMTNIMKILKNGTTSETRVRALASRAGSRIEQLFGAGEVIGWEQVKAALAS